MIADLTKEELKEMILEAVNEAGEWQVRNKEWWNLREACEKKGLCYKTACNRKELQPNGGISEGKIGGRKMWRWTTIERWLALTDDEILALEKK